MHRHFFEEITFRGVMYNALFKLFLDDRFVVAATAFHFAAMQSSLISFGLAYSVCFFIGHLRRR